MRARARDVRAHKKRVSLSLFFFTIARSSMVFSSLFGRRTRRRATFLFVPRRLRDVPIARHAQRVVESPRVQTLAREFQNVPSRSVTSKPTRHRFRWLFGLGFRAVADVLQRERQTCVFGQTKRRQKRRQKKALHTKYIKP